MNGGDEGEEKRNEEGLWTDHWSGGSSSGGGRRRRRRAPGE